MGVRPVSRAWTVTSWRLRPGQLGRDGLLAGLRELDSDVIALQLVRRNTIRRVADELDLLHAWAESHHPRSRLIPGSALGLAIVTPHRITRQSDATIGDVASRWSPDRRIRQVVTVSRSDHSAYALAHSSSDVAQLVPTESPDHAPLVTIRPATTTSAARLDLPDDAVLIDQSTVAAPDGSTQVTATFEMTWAQGGFAAS